MFLITDYLESKPSLTPRYSHPDTRHSLPAPRPALPCLPRPIAYMAGEAVWGVFFFCHLVSLVKTQLCLLPYRISSVPELRLCGETSSTVRTRMSGGLGVSQRWEGWEPSERGSATHCPGKGSQAVWVCARGEGMAYLCIPAGYLQLLGVVAW